MTRTIPLKIQNEYITGDKCMIGAAGSHNDVILRMEFSGMWDGLTKMVQFRDALGEATIEVLLTADMLEADDTSVYLVPVPNGAKKYAGEMTLCVKGAAVSGDKETRATTAVYGRFTVGESKWDTSAETEQDVTPTQAEQLQSQIENVLATIVDARKAATAAATSAQTAQSAASAATDAVSMASAAAKAASGSASQAQASAAAAAKSAASVDGINKTAQSWAVGGTGTREGEDTNNAKYWAEQAQQAAGGGVVSFNGRAGSVVPQAGDYNKGMVGLGNVDNTSDADKPVSTKQQAALDDKQAKITASGLLKGDGAGGVSAATKGTDYAGASETVTATLLAASWTGDAAPYSYALTVSGVTATSNQEVLPALNITAEQLEALQGANIQDGGQAANTMTLKAYGDKPTIDLPIRVIKRGD